MFGNILFDKNLMFGNILFTLQPLQSGEYRTSTIYSALKRLQKDGYVIYSDHYEVEDPFFREWIIASND